MNLPLRCLLGFDNFGNACHTLTGRGKDEASVLIRLQNHVDVELKSLHNESMYEFSDEYVDKKIHDKLLSIQDKLQSLSLKENVFLYPRHWKLASHESHKALHNSTDGSNSFTVATFNTLARGLSSGPSSICPTPFTPKEKLDGSYGGFTHLAQPAQVLDYDLRKWRLLHVLLGGGLTDALDANHEILSSHCCEEKFDAPFDILSLQEVDDYYSFWHPLLVCDQTPAKGIKQYQGVFQPKPLSPCVKFGWYSDGVVLLWNTNKFCTIKRSNNCDLKGNNQLDLDIHTAPEYWIEMGSYQGDAPCKDISIHDPDRKAAKNQVYIMVPLQRIGTNKIVVVAATHLKAKKGYMNERIRHLQALELKRQMKQMVQTLQNCGWKDVHCVILGDFNSEPDSSSVKCILEHNHDFCNMQSAYPLQDDTLYTTWKARKDGHVCRIIDYIFHSRMPEQINSSTEHPCLLDCSKILEVPKEEIVDELYPGFRYPSDHLLIAARFGFV